MASVFSIVDSLQNLTIHYVSYNMQKLSFNQHDQLLYLPSCVKNRILRKTLCVSSVSVKLGRPLFKQIFHKLVNDCTSELDLSNLVDIDSSIVKAFGTCGKLRQLTLDGLNDPSIIEDVAITLRRLKNMRKLNITNSAIVHSVVMKSIADCMSELEVLDLRGCSNFDDTCAYLMVDRLNKLQHLALSRTAIGCMGVRAAIENRTELRELMLNGCPQLQREPTASALLQNIADRLPHLRILSTDVPMDRHDRGDVLTRNRQCRCDRSRGDADYNCTCTRAFQQINFIVPL